MCSLIQSEMKRLGVFVVFLLFTSGVLSQITLLESGPAVLKPSETLKLSCKVTGYTISSGYWWGWMRQTPGKALEWLANIRYDGGSKEYAPSLQNRITMAVDSSKNEYSLQMKDMRAEETGIFYCARVNTHGATEEVRAATRTFTAYAHAKS